MIPKTAESIGGEFAAVFHSNLAARLKPKSSGRVPKICFIDQTGELGGAELCLLDMVAHFKDRSEVILFTDGPLCERLERLGVPVKVMPVPLTILGIKRRASRLNMLLAIPLVLHFAWRLSRELREYDVVFANTQKALVIGSIASLFAGKPLVWYLHDIITAAHFRRSLRLIDVVLGSFLASGVIANSEASRAAFLEGGGRNSNLRVVPNGINVSAFDKCSHERLAALRAELKLPPGPVIGVFSRLAFWKGQHILLQALQKLPGVQALVVGKPLFSGEYVYANDLIKLRNDLGLADRVQFLGFRSDLAELMQLCDVIAHTSVDPEPFGRVIVEGMLSEKPVVAARAGGAVEIVDHTQTGVLVEPGNADELAAAIRNLLDHPETAQQLATAARSKAEKCYSAEAMVAAVEEAICSCVKAG